MMMMMMLKPGRLPREHHPANGPVWSRPKLVIILCYGSSPPPPPPLSLSLIRAQVRGAGLAREVCSPCCRLYRSVETTPGQARRTPPPSAQRAPGRTPRALSSQEWELGLGPGLNGTRNTHFACCFLYYYYFFFFFFLCVRARISYS